METLTAVRADDDTPHLPIFGRGLTYCGLDIRASMPVERTTRDNACPECLTSFDERIRRWLGR